MVDISEKSEIKREAIAKGRIKLKKSTVELIKRKEVEKGDVIAVTKTAAILATKKDSRADTYVSSYTDRACRRGS
ncbi:cyclic pyranopterin monophosphate synthase MoaC [Sulfuracidifex metallicus]|uniref:cyclic pyranopterin monophosphate synthase MoaC n=1 Tax=Sulfuracidifex metallicus TaxID=47303 RepID=UPI000A6E5472